MAVIAMLGKKGGVGKTSITGHLTGEFLFLGKTVLALDVDPQGSLTKWASMGEGLLRNIVEPLPAKSDKTMQESIAVAVQEVKLVLVACPPGLVDASLWALEIADLVLLPCQPRPFDSIAQVKLLELVRLVQQEYGGRPRTFLVPNLVRSRTKAAQESKKALEALAGARVLPIGEREVIASLTNEGLTLAEGAPSSQARREFQVLAQEILKQSEQQYE
jgi:chromosome partitioning protein